MFQIILGSDFELQGLDGDKIEILWIGTASTYSDGDESWNPIFFLILAIPIQLCQKMLEKIDKKAILGAKSVQ